MGRLYIRTACWMIFLFCLGTAFQMVMTTYGYQTDRMLASVICVSVNVVASVVFIQFLQDDLKIAGLGIGSALGTLAQTITAYVSMRRKKLKTGYRLYRQHPDPQSGKLYRLQQRCSGSTTRFIRIRFVS